MKLLSALPVLSALSALSIGTAVVPADHATTAEPAAPFAVYLAPKDKGGNDANDGLTPETSVNTLVRAQAVLREHKPATDVEVRIKQGTYVAPPFHDWRFYVPGHTVSFMPIDYVPGQGMPPGGLPLFQGDGSASGFWLQPRLPKDPADPLYDGGDSGLRFYYLRVEKYSSGGVSIYGDSERDVEDETYDPPLRVAGSKGLNGNRFFGMQFRRLGDKWASGHWGYGGIVLTNSRNNTIENNHFVNIENKEPYGSHIHGAYITHYSSSTTVVRNRFELINGDPVKVRNMSNNTTVEYNTFTRTGRLAYYKGEFCDKACAIKNNIARQCSSYGNRFFYNTVNSGYNGGRISNWALSPEGLTHPGEPPCTIPDGDQRIRTGGNKPGG